jgi:hypothetical protein
MIDAEAWKKYPQHHKWFNKLYLAERMGYNCGPSGVAPEKTNLYIVRPIYNLSGMGAGASLIHIDKNDASKVPPGYFWCDFFGGQHYSITYKWEDGWKQMSCYQGYNTKKRLTYFEKWIKVNIEIIPPKFLNELADVEYINVEYKGTNPIEVHLRGSTDPEYDILIPIWLSTVNNIDILEKKGYKFIEDYDNADGFIEDPRIGFMVKE